MRARQWLLGLVGVGAVAGLTAAGCGSSKSSPPVDAGADSAEDSGDGAVCSPEMVVLPDAGVCSSCVTNMCGSQLTACNADCTCGGSINSIAGCLADIPPIPADGGLTALLGGAGLQLVTCIGGAAGGGGGGLLGGGAAGLLGGGGGGGSSAMSGYLTCLVTSCAGPCFGVGEGGVDAQAVETGPETGAADAPAESNVSETGTVDAPVESSTDAPGESSVDAAADSPGE
jgi:hypothetical protein